MSVGLKITRKENETWLETALRYAKTYGLEIEIRKDYNDAIRSGASEADAAFAACYNWDICDLNITEGV